MTINPSMPDLAAFGEDAVSHFEALYKDAVANYKALSPEERSKHRDPVRGKGDIRFGFALALANGATAHAYHETTAAPAVHAPAAPAEPAVSKPLDTGSEPETAAADQPFTESPATSESEPEPVLAPNGKTDSEASGVCSICGSAMAMSSEVRKTGKRAGQTLSYRRCTTPSKHQKVAGQRTAGEEPRGED
jgi:hypothetical protein